ncbi:MULTISPECIES: nitroreductase family deazaflavin-dependent oxidoreductase [unclassified Ornithinimicrobium]|uniref:nitroreductase family deazaflavin-dependent oxidoreductase n=1 Tax=unclassified Ornithinimicrobium TaxID=2615080 RepID=UPI00385347A4
MRRFANPLMIHLAGHGWFADLEHVGRRTGLVRHTPLLAFRDGDVVTVALTYGPGVQWLKNIRAAGGARMRLGRALLELGPPRDLPVDEGVGRMPQPVRFLFRRSGFCRDFIELAVVRERRTR